MRSARTPGAEHTTGPAVADRGASGRESPEARVGLEVRPFEEADEYGQMIDYFLGASEDFLRGMGVDPSKLPTREAWLEAALADHRAPDAEKERLYLAWLVDGELIGHSSLSHIVMGEQAHFHLHLWRPDRRRGGLGSTLVSRSVDLYFERFGLARILSEPYAENAAPNRLLKKLGFRLLRRYRTVPTAICFEQDVNRWEMARETWTAMRSER